MDGRPHQPVEQLLSLRALRTFGASAPLKDLQTKFGFTPDAVVEAAKAQIDNSRGTL